MESRRTLNYDLIRELHSKGMNDNEIARELNASINGIRYARKDVLGLPNNVKTYNLTPEMESIIVGTTIGDAWIGYVYKGCKYPKYQCTHCEKQKTYILTIYEKLKPIMTPSIVEYPEEEKTIRGKRTFATKHYTIASRNCDCLVPYREAFYPNGKKIIPTDFIKDKFTDISLAYWFMDDGGKDKQSNSYILNTQWYTKDNLEEFIRFLENKFGLLFSIKKDRSLYLRHSCNELFTNLVSKYVTSDMQYKLLSSLNSVKQGNS